MGLMAYAGGERCGAMAANEYFGVLCPDVRCSAGMGVGGDNEIPNCRSSHDQPSSELVAEPGLVNAGALFRVSEGAAGAGDFSLIGTPLAWKGSVLVSGEVPKGLEDG